MTSVTVSIVLHDSAEDIEACLAAIAAQHRPPDGVVILDNASTDDGAARAASVMPAARILRSPDNIGFAAGQNQAIRAAPADLHLVLNPDCRIAPDFLARAVAVLDADPSAGSVSGRLLRFRPGSPDGGPFEESSDDVLDSTGMEGSRNRRVLDRDTGLSAVGRHLTPAYVFGASGAAALYRRAMLEDVAYDGEFFDEAFFAYREDVDLAWRAQMLGWTCRYEPAALARHRRRVAPGRRAALPAAINRRSVANRWRMILKNETTTGWRRDWPAIVARDIGIVGYCAIREQRSLAAVADVFGDRGRLRDWRRSVMRARRASDDAVIEWFGRISERPVGGSPLGGSPVGGPPVGGSPVGSA